MRYDLKIKKAWFCTVRSSRKAGDGAHCIEEDKFSDGVWPRTWVGLKKVSNRMEIY